MPSRFPRSAVSVMAHMPDEEALREAVAILTRRGLDFAVQPTQLILWTSAEGARALQVNFEVADRPS